MGEIEDAVCWEFDRRSCSRRSSPYVQPTYGSRTPRKSTHRPNNNGFECSAGIREGGGGSYMPFVCPLGADPGYCHARNRRATWVGNMTRSDRNDCRDREERAAEWRYRFTQFERSIQPHQILESLVWMSRIEQQGTHASTKV